MARRRRDRRCRALLVPALAAGQAAVSEAPVAEQPAAPPGELAPVTETPAPAEPVAEQPATPPAEGPAAGDEVTGPVNDVAGRGPRPAAGPDP